jgi:N-acetylglucosaminyldiphosphoundecaprenol N-acetyl-beta-D-mannosaminyltransferase
VDNTGSKSLANIGDRVRVVSLSVNVCDSESITKRVTELVAAGDGGYICFSTVHMVMESYDDPQYGEKVNAANMVIPDGMPLVWMQKLQGRRDASRTRANDMMIELCSVAESRGWSVGFYGASQKVIDQIKTRAANDFPKLKIAYAFSPPFRALSEDEESTIETEIAAASPNLLFVGLGCPKQENWMSKNSPDLAAIMFGVGASFDFFAGNIKECPPWVGWVGLEWLFRLWQEPRRLWYRYLILNPRFILQAILQLSGLKRFD